MKKLLTACMLATLAACGGGGGGSSSNTNTNTNTGTPTETFAIAFSPATLTFDLVEGKTTPLTRTVTATANTTTTKSVVFTADVTGQGILTPVAVEKAGTLVNNIVISADPALKAGTYTGTIKLQACTTSACTEQHPGSPATVSYTVTVRAPIKPSQADVALSAAEGGSSGTLALGVTQPAGAGEVSYKVTYPAGQTTQWLKVTRNATGGLDLQAVATGLAAGVYTADLELVAAQPELSTKVPVKLTVGSGVSVTETVNVDLASATQPDAMKGELTVNSVNTGTWTATSSQTWLKLDTATGPAGGKLQWHVDPTLAGALANDAVHTANVTLTITGIPAKTIVFKLNKHMAQLRIADTYALAPGVGGEVLLYGSGLQAVDGQNVAIRVGTFAPDSFKRITDSVLSITMPPLDVGTYDVVLSNASGMPVSKTTLKVLAPQTYTYQKLETLGDKASLQWDDEGRALYVVNAQKTVERYAPSATGEWSRTATNSFANGVEAIGLTRDHSALIVSSGANTFYKLALTDLSTVATWPVGAWTAQPQYQRNPLPVLGDNRAMISNYSLLDLDTGVVTPYTGQAFSGLAPYGFVAPNGARMVLPGVGLSPWPTMAYTLALRGFATLPAVTPAETFTRQSANRSGALWMQDNKVYNPQQDLQGTLAVPSGWTIVAGVLADDGNRAYVYATNGSALPRIYVMNTKTSVVKGNAYPILGQFELADRPDCPGAFVLPTCFNNIAQMAISRDGRTLFVIGDRNLVVAPVPSSLSPAAMRVGGKALR